MYPGGMDLMTASFPTSRLSALVWHLTRLFGCLGTSRYLTLKLKHSISIFPEESENSTFLAGFKDGGSNEWRPFFSGVPTRSTFWALASEGCSSELGFDEASSVRNEISHNFCIKSFALQCQNPRTDFSVVPLSFFSIAAERIVRFGIWWTIRLQELKYLKIGILIYFLIYYFC